MMEATDFLCYLIRFIHFSSLEKKESISRRRVNQVAGESIFASRQESRAGQEKRETEWASEGDQQLPERERERERRWRFGDKMICS